MSRHNVDRQMLSATITTDALADRISAALRREYGEMSCAVQRIANAMVPPADPRAVRNWWYGRNPPSGVQLMRLGQVSAEVRHELVGILAVQTRNDAIALAARSRHEALVMEAGRARGADVPGASVGGAASAPHGVHRAVEYQGVGRRRGDPPYIGSAA